MLLCHGTGRVTAIPRDKIYWICSQTGRRGSSFLVRIMIFTEKDIFYMEGAEIERYEHIAARLYQYIPNIFSGYDPFTLSYELETLFRKNRGEFLKRYNYQKERT